MNGRAAVTAMSVVLVLALTAGCGAAAGYDVRVDLKNLSGEVKTNWPVILRVYTVLGRNLTPAGVNRKGFHVYDPAGREVPHALEAIPPYDQIGNDEIVFVVPKMQPGQTLSYRITNTSANSSKRSKIDVVDSPYNLLANGGFEKADAGRPAGFAAPARLDAKVKHAGKSSLLLTADNQEARTRCAKRVKLHKGSWYYFGVWSKTDNVSRFGYQAGNAAHFRIVATAADPKDPSKTREVNALAGSIPGQCSTREWLKATIEGGVDAWGMDRYAAKATQAQATVEFVLQQRKHFYMEAGKTRGRWWLDDAVLMEQPEVNVRFDLALKPLVDNGLFLFTRPPSMPLGWVDEGKRRRHQWAAMPYPHEKLTSLDKFALKGQRVSYCIGVYHTREVKDFLCRLAGGALAGPGGASIPVELIEYCPGYLGAGRGRYMKVLNSKSGVAAVTLAGDKGLRYFFLTFQVPKTAKAGSYAGKVELLTEKDKPLRSIPLRLRVQDMVQPIPKDVFVGIIIQGNAPPFNDAGLKVYSRSGFNCLMRFGGFLSYSKDAKGAWQVDLEKLDKTMKWLKGYGFAAVGVFSDFDLGPKWNGGSLLKRVRPAEFNKAGLSWGERLKTAEKAWKAQIKRIESARKKHPDWPVLIYMTWDEPNLRGGRNGRPDPAMGWVNEVAPEALTTLDIQFDPLPVCLKWYRVPAFDDPADWAGPELYRWIKRNKKEFGYCGASDKDEANRYQAGMLMISTGAKYFHSWHMTGGHIPGQVRYDGKAKMWLRSPAMINWADGMDDLKAHCLLKDAIAAARKDAAKARAVKAAEDYLRGVFAVWNGDHRRSWSLQPYLGTAFMWGYDGFYDDWQEQMLRHAAALKGVKWID